MKNRIAAILLLSALYSAAQVREFQLYGASVQPCSGDLYCAGLSEDKGSVFLKTYRIQKDLQIKDSLITQVGKGQIGEYLSVYSDTIHGFVHFYIQKKDARMVSIVRLDKNLSLVETVKDIDVARLNSTGVFGKDYRYWGKEVYALTSEMRDSSLQFYLNKYKLKSLTGNFEYNIAWQFPFERRDVNYAQIACVTGPHIYLYVWRGDGDQNTYWLLKVKTDNGQLDKATRIADKKDHSFYSLSAVQYLKQNRELLLAGQTIPLKQKNTFTHPSGGGVNPPPNFWYAHLDSLGELKSIETSSILVRSQAKTLKAQEIPLLRMEFIKSKGNAVDLLVDLFLKNGAEKCFKYSSSGMIKLNLTEGNWKAAPAEILSQPDIAYHYSTIDKHDRNGTICAPEPDLRQLLTAPLVQPARLAYYKDSENREHWLLKKSEVKKSLLNISALHTGEGKVSVRPVFSFPLAQNPFIFPINDNQFVSGTQIDTNKYQLKLYIW